MITLSDYERQRFATYLEQEAATYDGVAKEVDKLPGHADLGKPLQREAAAMAFVAQELRSQVGEG